MEYLRTHEKYRYICIPILPRLLKFYSVAENPSKTLFKWFNAMDYCKKFWSNDFIAAEQVLWIYGTNQPSSEIDRYCKKGVSNL